MGKIFSYDVQENVAVVQFGNPGEKVNTWTKAAVEDFIHLLDTLEAQKGDLEGIIFISVKPGNFHVGANLDLLAREDVDRLDELVAAVQDQFSRIENIGLPTMAAIHGACLGGGCEFVLAMTARIATDDPRTIIGLPECKVGVLPGAGGTQRLPRLIGYPAVAMIARGEVVPAARALELGIVDRLVSSKDHLLAGAKAFLAEIISGKAELKRQRHDFRRLDDYIEKSRQMALTENRRRSQPLLAVSAMHEGLKTSLEEGLKIERKYFQEVIRTPECRGSINTFLLKTYTDNPEKMLPEGFVPRLLKKLAVLGFGTMGRGITIDLLTKMQVPVIVKDVPEALTAGMTFVRQVLDDLTQKRKLRISADELLDLIRPVSEWTEDFRDVDLVVEAVSEDPDVKAQVYTELCQVVSRDCLITSNTSSIPITQLAKSVTEPQRFAGTHFFSPVWRMELLEIIRGEATSEETINNLVVFCAGLKKRPVVCNDHPLFVVNSLLWPYLLKAFEFLEAGTSIEKVDEAMVSFGLPVGPIKLVDEVGIDVIYLACTKSLQQAPPKTIENMVKAGRLGRKKSGRGFYLADGRVDPEVLDFIPVGEKRADYSIVEIQEMLFLPFVQVGKELLEKRVVSDPRMIDVGAIWGFGFPGDKGGPLKWADLIGLSKKLFGMNFYQ